MHSVHGCRHAVSVGVHRVRFEVVRLADGRLRVHLTATLSASNELLGLVKAGLTQISTAASLVALAAERRTGSHPTLRLYGRHAERLLEVAAHFNVAV